LGGAGGAAGTLADVHYALKKDPTVAVYGDRGHGPGVVRAVVGTPGITPLLHVMHHGAGLIHASAIQLQTLHEMHRCPL
jgi:hypothetical protein